MEVDAPPTTGAALHAFIGRRMVPGETLYAVLDSARDRQMTQAARQMTGQSGQSLFSGDAGPHMADVAPYLLLAPFEARYPYAGSGFLDLWAAEWGTSSGILLLTDAPPDKLLVHLRRCFRVVDEQYHQYYFRFYDPRVLHTYLPTCTGADAKAFFGPIRRLLVESAKPGCVLVCAAEPGGVRVDEQVIAPAPAGRPGGRT